MVDKRGYRVDARACTCKLYEHGGGEGCLMWRFECMDTCADRVMLFVLVENVGVCRGYCWASSC